MESLRTSLEKHRALVMRDLDLNQQLLTLLSKAEILDITDCVQIQQISDRSERTRVFLDALLRREDDAVYVRFIDSLHATGQTRLADRLIDIGEEMQVLSNMQIQLAGQLEQMTTFLATEERRAGVYLTEPAPEDDDEGGSALSEADVWSKVQNSIGRSQKLLARCQRVIAKLHTDCETVARQNADIVEYTKDCDARIKEVLNVGRHSAKQRSVPKKTQDIFENLMNDIEKLVRSRKKVLTKETEGRRHSTRIVRQCRDWLHGRKTALQKLNATPGPPGSRGRDHVPDDVTENGATKESPPSNDNAIMSILESLQLLERELQDYVHQEVTLSDKYRSELRRKHLQKQVHGFNVQGFEDMENALKTLQKNPDKVEDSLSVIQTSVNEINKEYGECVALINRVVPEVVNENSRDPSPRKPPKNFPDNLNIKTRPTLAGKHTRNHENNNINYLGRDRSEPNQLLTRLRHLVTRYDDMKTEDHLLTSKHRQELTRRKRDADIVLQKKDDQIMRLQTAVKEAQAEADKYKKLYNDTKIGYDDMKTEDHLLTSKHRQELTRRKRDADIVLQKKDDQIMRLQTAVKEAQAEADKYKKLYNDTKIGYQRNYESVVSPR